MNQTMSDVEEITAKVNAYVRGCETGDETHLKTAFHQDARMFGSVGADRYDVPVFGGLSAAVAEHPAGKYEARILAIDVEGDAASVKLAESAFWGQDFIDYFLLVRIGGEWQIVVKAFTHNGPTH